MTDPMHEQSGQDQLFEEASFWFARMRGPDADTHRPEFNAWLARGAAHLGAYNRAAEVFSMGKFLADDPDLAEAAQPLPLRRWPILASVAGAIALLGYGLWSVGTAPVLLGSGGGSEIAGVRRGPPAPLPVRLAAAAGQDRRILLEDGSKVTLRGGSSVMLAFTQDSRHLRLVEGQARFVVAHERRPFTVFAGRGSVTARGTIFDVSIDARQHVSVRLLRGAVDVSVPGVPNARTQRLAPGDVVRFTGGVVTQSNTGSQAATRDHVLADTPREFDDIRLGDLVELANAGAVPRIVLGDTDIANLRVSGRFTIADTRRLAAQLGAVFDLLVFAESDGEVMLRRR